jgi:hypothetical protein
MSATKHVQLLYRASVHTENRITWSEENPGKSVSGGFLFRDRRLSGHIFFFNMLMVLLIQFT